MKGLRLFIILLIVGFSAGAQKENGVLRPKLVVGLVVDQMRWDYLYRFYDRYNSSGFKRLMREGYNCENTMINYTPTYTGPGHACIYTGSVPAIHGIAGNFWVDNATGKTVYCVEDKAVHAVGGEKKNGAMSPRNLLTTTITDELRLATNMRSRVFGISIKDRSSILPAGHMANGAYWMDDSAGGFRSSSYYADTLPPWLERFNSRRVADSLIKQNWALLYPQETYIQSLRDSNDYERCYSCEKVPVFPHIMDSLQGKARYGVIKSMPAGNTLTFMAAMACIAGERLGQGSSTDFLSLSLSSTDYVGHQFGPNSIEVEDMYLRLDAELGDFLEYLDEAVGNGNYLFFLTADHGAAHNPKYLEDEDVPAGILAESLPKDMNAFLKTRFGKDSLVREFTNYQISLNNKIINREQLDKGKIKEALIEFLGKRPEVAYVADLEQISNATLVEPLKTMMINGYNRQRSGEVQVVLNAGWYDNEGNYKGTTHGVWNPYDAHIPLLWYGWNVPPGKSNNQLNMTDISATLAAMLHIQMPNGCIGQPILEITDLKGTKGRRR